MQAAPFYADLADGPDGAEAWWLHADDDVRLRVGLYPGQGAAQGTVLLFPGRTEYVEKYGRTARELSAQGYATLTIDWRGQGLADRLLGDTRVGHVNEFLDYQRDVAAMLTHAQTLGLPEPYFLIAHSMGGAIGLRSLHEGLPVAAVMFSAPMWGIRISPTMRPAAWVISWGSRFTGLSHVFAPGTKPESYTATQPFDDNMLTTDPEMFDVMRAHVHALPVLQLGGPSLRWLFEALAECHKLARMPSPDLPCLTWMGGKERIVDVPRIHARMDAWPGAVFHIVDGAEHEVMMEDAATRSRISQETMAFFAAHSDTRRDALTA